MFIGLVTVRIEKDNNILKYIKIIREYDSSLSISQIKKSIESGEVVFSFNSENDHFIYDGKKNKEYSLETLFIRCLKALKAAGAMMIVTEEKYGHICEEYGFVKSKCSIKMNTTDIAVITKIEEKWKLPPKILEFLKTHPDSQYIDIEDENTFDDIEIHLYGANDFIKGQDGYSYNPLEKTVIEEWNPSYLVIADSEANPFCIDISIDNSPVFFAIHGMGDWDFDEYCDSFESFLELLRIQ